LTTRRSADAAKRNGLTRLDTNATASPPLPTPPPPPPTSTGLLSTPAVSAVIREREGGVA
jgi:phosphoglucomutase